jgi:hypothetical protein
VAELGGSDPVSRVHVLLANFRLLEAAGACSLIAGWAREDPSVRKPAEWWEAVADSARAYRSCLFRGSAEGVSALDGWSETQPRGSDPDLVRERTRLGAEHRKWLCEIPGGQAYVAWLSGYVAVAELDGERALASLDRCATIVREFADVPGLGTEPSVYDFLQGAADALAGFLPLAEHPVRDMRRFAFLPAPLDTARFPGDALDLHSHR